MISYNTEDNMPLHMCKVHRAHSTEGHLDVSNRLRVVRRQPYRFLGEHNAPV